MVDPVGVLVPHADTAVRDVHAETTIEGREGPLVVEGRVEEVIAPDLCPPVGGKPVAEGMPARTDGVGPRNRRSRRSADRARLIMLRPPRAVAPVEARAMNGRSVDEDQVVRR